MLWRIGFTPEQISYLMNNARKEIRDFDRSLSYFEDRKVKKESKNFRRLHAQSRFPDPQSAATSARLLRGANNQSLDDTSAYMPDDIFCRIMAASYVGKNDLKPTRVDCRT
jgi:hypothetical protein